MTTYTCVVPENGVLRPASALPVSGLIALHWFPELEKIRNAAGANWTGGDLKTHLESIPLVLKEKFASGELQVGQNYVMDWNENPRFPLDHSSLCVQYMLQSLQEIRRSLGAKVGVYNPLVFDDAGKALAAWHYADAFDFLNPDIYPANRIVPVVGGDGDASIQWYADFALQRLQVAASAGVPLMVDIAPRYFWAWNHRQACQPWVLKMQTAIAEKFGDVCLFDNPQTPQEASECASGLAAVTVA